MQRQQLEYRITVLLGIIQQLQTTRHNKMLRQFDLNRSQFSVLCHFALQPARQCTISQLAEVMEINQPGITKIVRKLMERGFIDQTEGDRDRRKKRLFITPAGLGIVEQCQRAVAPDNAYCFAGWAHEELAGFESSLDKLKCWLDTHRDDILDHPR